MARVLIHEGRADVAEKLHRETGRMPVLPLFLSVLREEAPTFEILPEASGVDVAARGPEGSPGRCRLKLFRPREGHERLSVFFYKRSNLAWSRDRFSYGAVEFRPEQLTRDEVAAWLEWLVSGFDPTAKPERLRRAFLYDVPD
jgi:hypothetical protein